MYIILGCLWLSILVGHFFLQGRYIAFFEKGVWTAILLLMFVMGVEIGKEENLLQNIQTIGVDALIIASCSLLGSILLSWWIGKKFIKGKTKA